jgi:ATP-dependent DNA helicase RecG
MKKEESEDLEFKKKWRDEHLKTLSAFANSTGGELILGRDDKRMLLELITGKSF